jgi:hypothetical protein
MLVELSADKTTFCAELYVPPAGSAEGENTTKPGCVAAQFAPPSADSEQVISEAKAIPPQTRTARVTAKIVKA